MIGSRNNHTVNQAYFYVLLRESKTSVRKKKTKQERLVTKNRKKKIFLTQTVKSIMNSPISMAKIFVASI